MFVCDCKVLIGYQSSSAQEWCMMPPQPSEKGFHCWEVQSSRTVPGGTVLETAFPDTYHININVVCVDHV